MTPEAQLLAANIGNNIDAFGNYTESRWFSGDGETPTQERDLPIMSLGLAGEVGEVIEKIKKLIRDGDFDRENFVKEMGDVLFYWARIAMYFDVQPSEIIRQNILKLEDRRERGTMRGSGDNR